MHRDGQSGVGLNGECAGKDAPLTPFLQVVRMMSGLLVAEEIDLVDFVNHLLGASPPSGWRCTREANQLVLESDGHRVIIPGEPRALSMVRSICARLAELSRETIGCESFPYGGKGEINFNGRLGVASTYQVATMNTMGEQWFEIHPVPEATA
jgi:hypothetical protein